MADTIQNGSDLLLWVGTAQADMKLVAAATSHQITNTSEKKERKTKDSGAGLWVKQRVTKLSVTIKCDSLVSTDATTHSYDTLRTLWAAGGEVYCAYKNGNTNKWEAGNFIIDSIERTDPANDDSTMSISLSNSGEVTVIDKPGA